MMVCISDGIAVDKGQVVKRPSRGGGSEETGRPETQAGNAKPKQISLPNKPKLGESMA
jgi:hypothetical protein